MARLAQELPGTSRRRSTQLRPGQGQARAQEHTAGKGVLESAPAEAALLGLPCPRKAGSHSRSHHSLCWGGWLAAPESRCAREARPPATQTEGPGLYWREGTSEWTSANMAGVGVDTGTRGWALGWGELHSWPRSPDTPGVGQLDPLWLSSCHSWSQAGFPSVSSPGLLPQLGLSRCDTRRPSLGSRLGEWLGTGQPGADRLPGLMATPRACGLGTFPAKVKGVALVWACGLWLTLAPFPWKPGC